MDCTHANRCFLAFSGENSDVNFEGTVLVWPHLSLLHISRVFSSYHSQCGRRNNTRNPKGFAGSMAQEEASPCLQNTLKQRKFCCFCVEGKMGGHALPNLVGNVFFFFKKKNMIWTCQGWMKALILWGGEGHNLIPRMRFQSDAHIAWSTEFLRGYQYPLTNRWWALWSYDWPCTQISSWKKKKGENK